MYQINQEANGSYTVKIPNTSKLIDFVRQLAGEAAEPEPVYLSNAQAHAMAEQAGVHIPMSSLISACTRGTIDGAVKMKGRWSIPEEGFRKWAGLRDTRELSEQSHPE